MRAKSIVSILLMCSLLWVASCLVLAHDDAKHPRTGDPLKAQCFRAEKPVNVDGKLDEWKWVEPAEIKYKEQVAIRPENWKNDEDGSAKVFCMWDDDFIYVAVEVTDDEFVVDQSGNTIWQQDCLEIFFQPENVATDPGGWPHPSHYQFGLAPSGPNKEPQQWCWCNPDGNSDQSAPYITIASTISDPYKGYVVESSIELDAIPALAEMVGEGETVGYHCSLDDADGKDHPDSHITWSGGDPHDNRMFGNITFVGPAVVSAQTKAATTWGALKERHKTS